MSAASIRAQRLIRSLRRAAWLAAAAWTMSLAPTLAQAAEDLLMRQRIDEARQWERKGRDDLAADIWQRILALDPQNKAALAALGRIEARAGRTSQPRAPVTSRQADPETDEADTPPARVSARPSTQTPAQSVAAPLDEPRKKRRDKSSRLAAATPNAPVPAPAAAAPAIVEAADPVFDPLRAAGNRPLASTSPASGPTTLLAPRVELPAPKIPLPADLLVPPEFMPDPQPPVPADPALRPRPWSTPSPATTK